MEAMNKFLMFLTVIVIVAAMVGLCYFIITLVMSEKRANRIVGWTLAAVSTVAYLFAMYAIIEM